MEFASRYTVSCRSCHSNDLSALAKDKEGHTVDDCSATEHKMENVESKLMLLLIIKRYVLQRPTVKLMLSKHNRHDRYRTQQIMTADRMITADRLRGKVSENNNWSPQQPEDLNNVLIKYQHLTERP